MSQWLTLLGAKVSGFSLEPMSSPNFFTETKLSTRLASSTFGDIRSLSLLSRELQRARPEVVIHMAAQSLVRESYKNPVDTFGVNLLGTVHLLEAVRETPSVRAVIVVTSDKSYENQEWVWPYRENDRLGGRDPYSASKATAELAVSSYRDSFFLGSSIQVATVRAGNVIGGGDWSTDRLIPDFLRAAESRKPLKIRSATALRPWQHVLEPINGYLLLARKLLEEGGDFEGAWNFGPNHEDTKPVSWIVDQMSEHHPGVIQEIEENMLHEAQTLRLDSAKARVGLNWAPRWDVKEAIAETIAWNTAWQGGMNMDEFTTEQILRFALAD